VLEKLAAQTTNGIKRNFYQEAATDDARD